ncbi:MAG: tetratricopeptide repeat protein [Acidobacteriia bacterium]|nr:tetratricopeptide repeat protein [Terriglobia bacterium]
MLQESGYALKAKKDLILFREPGVEIPGLQGDLEYIPFESANPAGAFQKASEMISKLVARASGITVETVAAAVAESSETEMAPSPPQAVVPSSEPEMTTDYFDEVMTAISLRDWEGAEAAYQKLIAHVREKDPGSVVRFQAIYHRRRFSMGHPDALDALRSLSAENPHDPIPMVALGGSLFDFEQYTEAAECYKAGSALAEPSDAVRYQIRAADCLRLAKKPDESREILLKAWASTKGGTGELKYEILRALYNVLKETEEVYPAFAIAEMALHENPTRGEFRFSVGFDYDTSGYYELFLRHYNLICEWEPENASALHNLGLAYSRLKLPISSVSRYKDALALGETLSASNLGYLYLNAGMVDEAVKTLQEAQNKKGCDPQVTRCLATVYERQKKETEEELSKLGTAKEQQAFLVSFGRPFLSDDSPPLEGKWEFPFGIISLQFTSGKVLGEAVVQEPAVVGLKGLCGLGTPQTADRKFERVSFSGDLHARTCKYRMSIQTVENPGGGTGNIRNALAVRLAGILGSGARTEE